MSSEGQAEWQPARFIHAHRYEDAARLAPYFKKVIRIRPYPARRVNPADLRELECDATKFYEIHPEDCEYGYTLGGTWVCEHEILTD